MIHDKKLLGVCGETELANAKQSLITMMQVCAIITTYMAYIETEVFDHRCMSTLYLITWPKLSSPCLAPLLVYLVVSLSIVSALPIPTSLYSFRTR